MAEQHKIDMNKVPKGFFAVLTQEGGCDYTIGCGVAIIQIRARDLIEAWQRAEKIAKEKSHEVFDVRVTAIIEGWCSVGKVTIEGEEE